MNVAISRNAGLLYALAVALPFTAQAEETVVVIATPPASASAPTEGYSASTSLGATKTDQPLIATAQSVSVVTRQQMADQGANTISRGAGIYPGVYSSFGGGATRFDAISLRGYHGGDVDNLFLDGMRLMSDGGSHNVLANRPVVYRTRGCDPRPLLRALRAERAGRRGQPDFQTSAVQSAGPHPPDRRHAKYQRRGLRLHRRHQ